MPNSRSFNQFPRLCKRSNNKLILFGTKALYPETGYGYIKYGGRIRANLYEVADFIEKPSLITARICIAEGDLWNCGIFIFPVKLLLFEIKKHAPEIYHACNKAYIKAKSHAQNDKRTYHIDPPAFSKCPADSIDYSVLEKSARIAVLKSNIVWNDIGSWRSMYEIGHKDADGNILEGEVIAIDCKNAHIINNNPSEIIALIGSKNLTVVKSGNATIVLPRTDSQKVRQVVELIKKRKKSIYLNTSD